MTGKKKVLFIVAGISLIIVVPIALLVIQLYSAFAPLITNAPNHVVEDYVEEKYGFKVDVIETNSYGIGSTTEYTVSPKDDGLIQFMVSVDPYDYTVIEDDYNVALEIDKEYEKLKTVIPEIEALGFSGMEGAPIHLHYIEGIGDTAFLHLESDKPVNYATFVEEDFDTYYELYELVKKSQANVENVAIFGTIDQNGDQKDISFYMGPPEKVISKEELLLQIKTGYLEIVEYEVVKPLEKEAARLNNERFHFGNQYDDTFNDPFDSWFNCNLTNEDGKCTSAVLSITYQKGGLNADNPFLSEDLNTIFKFIEMHLEPEIKVDHIFLKGDELSAYEEFDIEYEDRITYTNTDDLINFIFTEQ
ncbi:hypothetical protein [Planococcus soli]|uniref:hypothetical protein n=1 Tax=Planococcus soli TaxID=2666072 RepID=UPI00115E0935|nr:hypothetical protein [Planococcus soli]